MRTTCDALAIGAVAILLSIVPARASCTEDLYEAGDTCHSALAIAGGEAQSRAFCDTPEDWGAFNACAGRTYVLRTTGLGSLADTVLDLFGPSCAALLASDDNGGGGLASRITWVAPESGLYHVRIRQADASWGPDRSYELLVSGETSSCGTYSRADFLGSPISDVTGVATSDGGVLAFSSGTTAGPRGTETIVVKLTAAGIVAWSRTLGLNVNDTAIRAIETADGGFIAVGRGGFFLWIVKLTAFGQIVWQRGFQQFSNQTFSDLIALPDGGALLAGSYVWGQGISDAWLLRLDSTGAILWSRLYDGSPAPDQGESDDYSLGVRRTSDGGFVLLGINGPFLNLTIWVTRLTANGSVLWTRNIPHSAGGTTFGTLAVTSDGGVAYAVERLGSTSVGKLDGAGNTVWQRRGGPQSPRSLAATADGGVVLTGPLGPTSDRDAAVVRFDGSGNVLWQRLYGQAGMPEDLDVLSRLPDGGFRFVGWRSGVRQLLVIQSDKDGQVLSCAPWQNGSLGFTPITASAPPMTLLEGSLLPFETGPLGVQTGNVASALTEECSCPLPPVAGPISVQKVSAPSLVSVAWTSPVGYRYDVVTGSLGVLAATGGDFTSAVGASSAPACLAQDTTSLEVSESSLPSPGDGVFYLVRAVDPACLLGGTYDSGAPSQISGRDTKIAASPSACP